MTAEQRPGSEWHRETPRVIVLMGVAGCGKSTTGRRLGSLLDWPFRDGDEFHPPENIAKMASGRALDDQDRAPWLAAIARWIDQQRSADGRGIVACSALKRGYRRVLIGTRPDVALVYLKGSYPLIADRLSRRRGHFMPTSLLTSQFAALEEPAPEENAVTVSMRQSPKRVVEQIVGAFGLLPASRVCPQ